MKIKNIRNMEYFTAADGCKITELFGIPTEGIHEGSVAFAILPPGNKTEPHSHEFHEWYIITQGKGVLYGDNGTQNITTGDTIHMTQGGWHSIENTGSEDLELYCFCTPAFTLMGTTMKDGSEAKESVERKFSK